MGRIGPSRGSLQSRDSRPGEFSVAITPPETHPAPESSVRRTPFQPCILAILPWLVLLMLVPIPSLAAQQQVAPGPWAWWLSILADGIKVFEAAVVMFGVAQLWIGRGERRDAEARAAVLARKAANYQAWQVINSAQGKGGSGGRVDALADLIANDVSLAGVKLDGAWLEKAQLEGAQLRRASFEGTNLTGASLQRANLQDADLSGATLVGADLRNAVLRGALVRGALLSTADLRGADLAELQGWESVPSFTFTNIEGVKNAPPGFREFALERGAVDGDRGLEEQTVRSFSTEWRAV